MPDLYPLLHQRARTIPAPGLIRVWFMAASRRLACAVINGPRFPTLAAHGSWECYGVLGAWRVEVSLAALPGANSRNGNHAAGDHRGTECLLPWRAQGRGGEIGYIHR